MSVPTSSKVSRKKRDRRSDLAMIYFHQITEHDGSDLRIKIGKTTGTVEKRLEQHQANPLDSKFQPVITPICAVQGKGTDENHIHNYFKSVRRAKKEIFEADDDLVDYIRWLRDREFVWIPGDKDCDNLEDLPIVDSSMWLPNDPLRRKTAPKGVIPGLHGPLNLPPRELTADDFYTNEIIIEKVRALMGRIDVDPASHAVANRVVKAKQFFTLHDNGLDKKWAGKVWINPPFSQWKLWVPKILSEWKSERVNEMCVLCAMRTVTAKYFNPFLKSIDAVCIMKGRIPFWGSVAGDSPDDGHCIFYFGENRAGFNSCFSELGAVFFNSKGSP